MTKSNMSRAFGVIASDKRTAQDSADLMKSHYESWHLVKVVKATYREATERAPDNLHLYCRVEGDPRPVNLSFICFNPEKLEDFRVKLAHLFRALGTDNVDNMAGARMMVLLRAKTPVNPKFFHSYLAVRTEPVPDEDLSEDEELLENGS